MRSIPFIALVSAVSSAQTPDAAVTFEVATIKLSAPVGMGPIHIGTRGGPGTPDPGRFSCERCSLMMLISTGYDINSVQIFGPSWLIEQQFDLAAKIPEGATKAQFRVMVRNLLVERFKIAVHRDKKEMPIFELTVAKGGPKLKNSPGPPDEPPGRSGGPSAPPPPRPVTPGGDGSPQFQPGRFPMGFFGPRGARLRMVDETMQGLATRLQSMVGRPVTDATGLTGKYDFELSFSPNAGGMTVQSFFPGLPPPPPGPVQSSPDGAPSDDSGVSLLTALQEQLGLKLESKKGPVDTLVIDHIEKTPTEN
jgi:uncharacterized protein (TIGR03435 family)